MKGRARGSCYQFYQVNRTWKHHSIFKEPVAEGPAVDPWGSGSRYKKEKDTIDSNQDGLLINISIHTDFYESQAELSYIIYHRQTLMRAE